jgi:RimJ/RimL family protein N-acetyltransferase
LEDTFRKTQKTDADHLMFKAVRETDRETVGHIELMCIDRTKKAAHIGRVLICRPEQRGKGYGSRMISLLVDMAFNTMDMQELMLTVFDYNRSAIACYTKIGFRLSGYQENVRHLGRHWNIITMKLTKDYWISRMDTS